jgi:hypothetical protein
MPVFRDASRPGMVLSRRQRYRPTSQRGHRDNAGNHAGDKENYPIHLHLPGSRGLLACARAQVIKAREFARFMRASSIGHGGRIRREVV